MEERKFSEQELVRREKMQELIDKGIDPFGQRFDVTAYSKGIKEQYGDIIRTVDKEKNKQTIIVIPITSFFFIKIHLYPSLPF